MDCITTIFTLLIALASLVVSIIVLFKTIEWQKRTTEKNIFTQIIIEQWKQDWASYASKVSTIEPESLTERMIKKGVLKKN